jgi:hypothetical protein
MDFLKKLFEWLVKIILAVLIVLAVVWSMGLAIELTGLAFLDFVKAAVLMAWEALGWYSLGLVVGIGFLIDPELTAELVTDVAEVVGDVVAAAAEIAGEVGGSLISGLASTPFGIAAMIGLGIWAISALSDSTSDTVVITPQEEAYG